MTRDQIEALWREVVALAETVFRQAAGGAVPDRDAAGGLAERVLTLDRIQREEIAETGGEGDEGG